VSAALWLVFAAAFPYFFAESGSSGYARSRWGVAITQILGAAVLLWIASYCIRHSLSARMWLVIAALFVAAMIVQSIVAYRQAPAGLQPAGARWYVTVVRQPTDIDTVHYHLYYKNGGHYELIDDLVSEYHFVSPDCLTFRGLKVGGRPIYAMCGYRSPAGASDTSTAESTLLAKARTQPAFREDWKSVVQQQEIPPTSRRR
jgi:hypothetical protein